MNYSKLLKAVNNAEFLFEPSDPVVKTGAEAQLDGQNPHKTQIPNNSIKADLKGEHAMRRDKPIYAEDDKEESIYNEGVEESDPELAEGTWVKAFKSGTHTDSEGQSHKWDISDIKMIAQQYNKKVSENNPERHVAPVVIGHPDDKAPAWGYIEKAKAIDGKLWLKLNDLQPEFTDAVNKGMYKMRSISLYPDLGIRHLGFLGGAPPAVKGLVPYKFSATDNCETYNFGEDMEDINSLKQEVKNLREENKFSNFIAKIFGKSYKELAAEYKEDGSTKGEILSQDKPTVETINGKFPDGATMKEKEISKMDHAKYAKSYAMKGKSFLEEDGKAIEGISGTDISAKLSEFARLAVMHHSYSKMDPDEDDDVDNEWKKDECSYGELFNHIMKHADSMIPSENAITSGNYEEMEEDGEEGINEPKKVTIPVKEISDDQEEVAELSREVAELKEEISKLTGLNERLMAEKAEEQKKNSLGEFAQFCDDMIGTGRILPRDTQVIIENFKIRSELDAMDTRNFAEGKISKPTVNRVQEYKDYFESMPQTFCYEELCVGAPEEQKAENFVEAEVRKIKEAKPTINYSDALDIIKKSSPENEIKVNQYIMDSFKQ